MEPRIQYVTSADGVRIAYTTFGQGPPLIFSPNIWSHLEVQLSGEFGEAFQRLAQEGLLVVAYDMRGMGMSDRDVDVFSLNSQLGDIEALRERLGLDRFALYGNVFACLASIAYAAARRERVSHLILNLPFANGEDWYQAMPTLHGLETFRNMAEHHWEAYTLTHATALLGLLPGADPRSMAALMRECTTPDTFSRYLTEVRTQDVRSLLAKVSAPSLILSPASGGPVIVEAGRFAREVAAGISDARLVSNEASFGRPGLPTARLAAEFILGRMIEWSAPPTIAYPDPEPRAESDAQQISAHATAFEAPSGTAIILFADIADSTGLTERLGDAAFRKKARDLDATLRTVIRDHTGTPIEGKLLGDGVLAVFTSARQAIEAALACDKAGGDGGLPLHLGLHAGDVIREDNNVYGGAVNVASRISGLSAPGEVLVSETVRSLARTSAGVAFDDRGEQELKGVGEAVRVWAVVEAAE